MASRKNKQRNGANRDRKFRSGESNFQFNNNRFFQNNSFGGSHRETHKATCADCKKTCEVPFKPAGDKPVYCRECYAKHKPRGFNK